MTSGLGVSELEHVLVLSDDIEAAGEFYERALGLRIGDRPPFEFTGHWLYRAGIEPVRNDVPGGGPRQLFFNDPEGLRVEINVKA